ncbi:MAG: trypsin-like peptidase domain-containing protein [Simkania sp.]|nr:trypsin-like peptidase domain-containing protein [Simkania sp.]
MKQLTCFFLLCCSLVFGSYSVEESVVKIYQTRNAYDYESPWSSPFQEKRGGSGFIISGNRILTNAHVVSDAAFIQVKKAHDSEKYLAEVEWLGHDCDLAILTVPDEAFFEGTYPLEIATEIAPVQAEVKVLGYPVGGVDLSVTRGIISRTEVCNYNFSRNSLLCSQIDAPLNPGNSGGPVLENGKVVGVAHQAIFFGQNLGYMIPIPIIRHFLKEVDEGKYHGFPKGGVRFQTMENPALRGFYQMGKETTGVLITLVNETSFFHDKLYPGDVLLAIDGVSIANDGTIDFENRKRVSLSHLFSIKYYDEFIDLEILRDGERLTLSVHLQSNMAGQDLVGEIQYNKRPTYYTVGGLVFQPLTVNYLIHAFEQDSPALNFLYYLKHGKISEDRSQVVVLTRVLPDSVNVGYQKIVDEVVSSVNGVKIRNIRDLINAFEKSTGPYIHLALETDGEIVLDREHVLERNTKILSNYLIPNDRSEDLR